MKELIEELFRLSQKARRENKGKYGREILTLSDFRKELFGAIDPRVMETKKQIIFFRIFQKRKQGKLNSLC